MFDVNAIQISMLFENGSSGSRAGSHILLCIGGIDALAFLLIGHDFHRAFEKNHIISIACMNDNPGLLGEIFGFLHSTPGNKVDTRAIPHLPDGNRMGPSIRPRSAHPDGTIRLNGKST